MPKPTKPDKKALRAAVKAAQDALKAADTPEHLTRAYRMRKCRLCKSSFKPTTKVISCANTQEFCCPNHRKEFWKYGGLPFDKMLKRIEIRCKEIARQEIEESFTRVNLPGLAQVIHGINEQIAARAVRTEQHPTVKPASQQSA